MKRNKINIAITGGIGSGKSTVAGFIKKKGYNVVSCDEVYEKLLCSSDFLKTICNEFGNVLTAEGKLDRKKLSEIVFGDKEKLEKLNKITHGKIMEEAFAECIEEINFVEVPLLFENGFEKLFDSVIVVLREENARIESVVNRDNLTPEQAKNRLKNQIIYDMYDFAKYYVIHNKADLSYLQQETDSVLDEIKDKYL